MNNEAMVGPDLGAVKHQQDPDRLVDDDLVNVTLFQQFLFYNIQYGMSWPL
jgi:hypothetical protein